MSNWGKLAKTQPIVVKMLINSVLRDRLSHAYLFEGGRGTGKKETALLFAKTFFCENREEAEPCQTCRECKRIDSGNHPDVHWIRSEEKSIKVDQIRELIKQFNLRGMESTKKVYIVEDAEKMTMGAANSILKFLEEPIGDSLAILTTTNVYKMLNTIKSRAQVLPFLPLSSELMIERLVEEGVPERDAQAVSQITSDLAEAIQLCQENWIAQARSKVIQLVDDLSLRPKYAFITLQEEWIPFFKDKTDVQIGIDLLMLWYRDLIRMKVDQTNQLVYIDQEDMLQVQSLKLSQHKLGKNLQAVMDAKRRLDANTAPQLLMEQLLLRLQEG